MANATTIPWPDDHLAEAELRKCKLPRIICTGTLDEIDWVASKLNCGRLSAKFDKERAEGYAVQMMDGQGFPRPVMARLPNGKLVILGGFHRMYAAREAKLQSFEYYLVDTKDELILDELPMLLNRKHGINVNNNDAMTRARALALKYDLEHAAVAERWEFNYDVFNRFMNVEDERIRLVGLGFEGSVVAKLTRDLLLRSMTIKNDNVCRATIALTIKHNVRGTAMHAFFTNVKAARNEKDALAAVQTRATQLEQEKQTHKLATTPTKLPKRDSLYRQLHSVINTLSRAKTAQACQITSPEDLEEVNAKFRLIAELALSRFGAGAAYVPPTQASGSERGPDSAPPGGGTAARGRRTTHVR